MKKTTVQLSVLVLAATILGVAPTFAQKQTPPEGGPAKSFNLPASETYALPNGMKVTLVPYGIIPKAAVSIALDAGSLNERRDRIGVSDLTGDLFKEGTASLTSQQLAENAARMGSTLQVSIASDQSDFSMDVLQEFAPDAVRLLGDVLQHPRFPESEVARLKNDFQRRIATELAEPQTVAEIRFRKLLYGDHPYGTILPAEDDVKKLTLPDVKEFYDANFGAQRAHIYVAGKFDAAAVKNAIAETFGNWAKGPAKLENVPSPKPNHVLDLTDRPGAPQSTLVLALPVPGPGTPDAIPLGVTNALLGGSFNSRITANIREQKGYTYSPYSEISRHYHTAYWAQHADVTTQFTGPSIKEIFGEIERLQKEPPSALELKGIQSYLSGVFVIQNSSRDALIGQLQYVDFQGLGDDYLKNYVPRVNAVTTADVQKMTARYIKPEEMTIVVVGDKVKISDQLAPFIPAK
jgi:predicted Zn-dependent peptidase